MAELSGGRVISGEREIARERLLGRALHAAGGFAALGVKPGDAVALVLRHDFSFFEASYAAQMLGAYCVPVNWHGKAPEIGYVLRDCGAKAVVVHADLLPQVVPVLPDSVTLLIVPTPPEIAAAYGIPDNQCRAPAGTTVWDEWLAACSPLANPGAGGLSSMIYTSGTTGHPKGVKRLNLGSEFVQVVGVVAREVLGFEAGQPVRTVITGPLYHSAPNFYGLYAVREGALAILQPRFEPEELLRLIDEYRITHLHVVPTIVCAPAASARRNALPLRCLLARAGRPWRRALPDSCQARHDRLVGAGHHRVLRRHGNRVCDVPYRRRSIAQTGYRRPPVARCHDQGL